MQLQSTGQEAVFHTILQPRIAKFCADFRAENTYRGPDVFVLCFVDYGGAA